MSLTYAKAVKELKPLKIMLYGPTYCGKTLGSLKLAVGIIMEQRKCDEKEAFKHILLVDTEYGRGSLYAAEGEYNYYKVEAPFTLQKLNMIVSEVENDNNIDALIIDSHTAFWSKKGGILDQKLLKDQQGGNSYGNWNGLTQDFNASLDIILASTKHIIVTNRSKTDAALVLGDNGKTAPKVYGIKPEMRDGIEYEYDIVINIDKDDHTIILDKAIPGLDRAYPAITYETGSMFYKVSIDNAVKAERTADSYMTSIRTMCKSNQKFITKVQMDLKGRQMSDLTLEELKNLEDSLLDVIKKEQA